MKKRLIILCCLIIFLCACAPAPIEDQTLIIDKQVSPEPVKKESEQIKKEEPEPEKIVLPLDLAISAEQTTAELELLTQVTCTPSGGEPPYMIGWWINGGEYPKCEDKQTCGFDLKEIGSYHIRCSVRDQTLIDERSNEIKLEVTKQKIKVDNILTFGDSLTYGHGLQNPKEQSWPTLFAKKYKSPSLHNYAVSGDTSWGVTEQHLKFNQTMIKQTKDKNNFVFIWIGANDIHRFIPKEQYESNLRKVINELKQMPNSQLILINIPDASKLSITQQAEQGINQILGDLGVQGEIKVTQITKDIVADYNKIVDKVAKDNNLPLLDMFTIMQEFDNELISEDFFHPNAKGQQRIVKEIQAFIEGKYPQQEFY